MDCQNSFSQTEGFVNLLSSQLVHDPYSPCIELGSSQVLLFSTQGTDGPSLGGDDRKVRRAWTPKEDLILISAWLNTSKDPIVANEQKAGSFWTWIHRFYNSSPLLVDLPKRDISHCKQRWGRINDHVCKFVGSYAAATNEKTSGQNENDVMKAAHEIFFNDYLFKFNLDHAWRELRHDQKWCATPAMKDGGKGKRRKVEAGTGQSSMPENVGDDVTQVRPPGVKASKRKGKSSTSMKKESEEIVDLGNVWKIKQKDLALKKEIVKHKVLDRLLAKTELSENETALKNKLINELL
ncbi:glutathione S-transferase T3-like [Eutrema salsugineum]|uniref:glutathione S-transferase T3-like n=1 Tax=Eutrema salsugineum TaxID=72664 RepID=UPI000CECE965|nr:glutathione S-transferase T3-like [Eutrema salsugineum]